MHQRLSKKVKNRFFRIFTSLLRCKRDAIPMPSWCLRKFPVRLDGASLLLWEIPKLQVMGDFNVHEDNLCSKLGQNLMFTMKTLGLALAIITVIHESGQATKKHQPYDPPACENSGAQSVSKTSCPSPRWTDDYFTCWQLSRSCSPSAMRSALYVIQIPPTTLLVLNLMWRGVCRLYYYIMN